jgi:hypothetical protein
MFDNSEILIIWHFVVIRSPEVLLYTKTVSVKLTDLRDMFRKASLSDSTSTVVESPDPLCPTPSTYEDKRNLMTVTQQLR